MISDLLIELLSVLTNYSITVKETKHFLRALYACDDVWVIALLSFHLHMNSLEKKFLQIAERYAGNAKA